MRKIGICLSVIAFVFVIGPELASAATTSPSTISANTTWNNAGDGIWVIDGTVTISSGASLTIDSGVVVKFKTQASTLVVNGSLVANGTSSAATIYFTSYRNDIGTYGTTGWDTNSSNDGPAVGDWREIKVNSGGSADFKHIKIDFGGNWNYSGSQLWNSGGTVTLATTTATSSYNYGLYQSGGTTSCASDCDFSYQFTSVYISGGTLTIDYSDFHDNGYFGIFGSGSSNVTLNNNHFYDNDLYGAGLFYFGSGLTFSHTGNTSEELLGPNGINGFLTYGHLQTSQTWNADSMPYVIYPYTGPVGFNVGSGKTLTLDPGAVVKFATTTTYLAATGTILALGKPESPVYFTSLYDDVAPSGNDTDGTATAAARGDWKGILMNSASSTFSHSIIKYGGCPVNCAGDGTFVSQGNIYQSGGILNLSNSTSTIGGQYGIVQTLGTLNISGTEVSSANATGIYSTGGTLVVEGTSYSTSNIKNQQSYGLYTTATTSVTVEDSWFENNGIAAFIYTAYGLDFTHSGNIATGTGIGAFNMYGGIFTAPAAKTWTGEDGMPYYITGGEFKVFSGKTLNLEPLSVVKFNEDSYLTVDGVMEVVAEAGNDPIVAFTSINDDSGGDAGGDGYTTGSPGDWVGIITSATGSTTLRSAIVRFGGASTTLGQVTNQGGDLLIMQGSGSDESHIDNSYRYGVWTYGGTTIISSTTMSDNDYGYAHSGGTSNISDSIFSGNSVYGFVNYTTSTTSVAGNFWPATTSEPSTGPYHEYVNPDGNGDEISDYVSIDSDYIEFLHFVLDDPFNSTAASTTTHVSTSTGAEILWATTTQLTYLSEFQQGIAKWNALGRVSIATSTGTYTLQISEINEPLTLSRGSYNPQFKTIKFNLARLAGNPSSAIIKTATHELGHALGLAHSYLGNIMYLSQTDQAALGYQDELDYNYLGDLLGW